MAEYRAYTVGLEGRFISYEKLTCSAEAVADTVSPLSDTLAEVDDIAPVHPGICVANSPARRAAQMRADIAPIPWRQIAEV